jgi:hypothetical protein
VKIPYESSRNQTMGCNVEKKERIYSLRLKPWCLRAEPATALGTSSGFAVLNKSHNLADLRFLEPPDTYRKSEPN